MKVDTTTIEVQRFRTANPQPWERCDGSYDESCICPKASMHIFHEGAVLYAVPECSQERFAPAMVGYLALAGVRVQKPTAPDAPHDACVLLDEGQIELAVATLNAAGANVTVVLNSQP